MSALDEEEQAPEVVFVNLPTCWMTANGWGDVAYSSEQERAEECRRLRGDAQCPAHEGGAGMIEQEMVPDPAPAAPFRVEVYTEGEWVANAMRYRSAKAAWEAGDNLMGRWFVPTDMRVMHADQSTPWAVYSCSQCAPYMAGGLAPSHRGSVACTSGSLAAGGTRSHCSCDTCF